MIFCFSAEEEKQVPSPNTRVLVQDIGKVFASETEKKN